MALTYKVAAKKTTLSEGKEHLYYPVITDRKVADLQQISEEISNISTVHSADVLAVMDAFRQTMLKLLEEGYNVKVDELGTFSVHASAKGKDDPEKVSHRDITKLRLTFLPGNEIKDQVNHFKVRKKR